MSVDGLRQDFIIESPPLHAPPSTLNPQHSTLNHSAGDLRVELALSGARAKATADGVKLTFENVRAGAGLQPAAGAGCDGPGTGGPPGGALGRPGCP